MRKIKTHWLPILLLIGGILDQSTDLMAQFLKEIEAPDYYATLFRIFVISFGGIKLYLTQPPEKQKA